MAMIDILSVFGRMFVFIAAALVVGFFLSIGVFFVSWIPYCFVFLLGRQDYADSIPLYPGETRVFDMNPGFPSVGVATSNLYAISCFAFRSVPALSGNLSENIDINKFIQYEDSWYIARRQLPRSSSLILFPSLLEMYMTEGSTVNTSWSFDIEVVVIAYSYSESNRAAALAMTFGQIPTGDVAFFAESENHGSLFNKISQKTGYFDILLLSSTRENLMGIWDVVIRKQQYNVNGSYSSCEYQIEDCTFDIDWAKDSFVVIQNMLEDGGLDYVTSIDLVSNVNFLAIVLFYSVVIVATVVVGVIGIVCAYGSGLSQRMDNARARRRRAGYHEIGNPVNAGLQHNHEDSEEYQDSDV